MGGHFRCLDGMRPVGFATALLFLSQVAEAGASTFLSCPKTMPLGSNTACYAAEPVTRLQLRQGSATSVEATAPTSPFAGAPGVFTFRLASASGLLPGEYVVMGLLSNGSAAGLSVTVTVVAETGLLLIGTDKGIYRPGAEVKVRTLHLSASLKLPMAGEVTIAMKNPTNFKIVQETLMADEYGVASTSIQLASVVQPGVYQLEASVDAGAHGYANFTVKDYVLPKFEVKLKLDSTDLLVSDDVGSLEVSGSVHGMYTYGEPVPGTLMLHLRPPNGNSLAQLQADLEEERGRMKPFTLMLPRSRLPGSYLSHLLVDAVIVDKATGTVENSSAIVNLHREPEIVQVDMDETFKPGLPHQVRVTVLPRGSLGMPMDSYTLQATWRRGHDTWGEQVVETLSLTKPPFAQPAQLMPPTEDAGCCDMSLPLGNDYAAFMNARSCCIASLEVQVLSGSRYVQNEGTRYSSRAFSLAGHYLQAHLVGEPRTDQDSSLVAVLAVTSTLNLNTVAGRVAITGGGTPLWSGAVTFVPVDPVPEGHSGATMELRLPTDLTRGLKELLVVLTAFEGQDHAADSLTMPVPRDASAGYSTTLSWRTTEARPAASVQLDITSAGAARVFLLGVDLAVDLASASSPAPAIDDDSLQLALATRQSMASPPAFAPRVCPYDAPFVKLVYEMPGFTTAVIDDPGVHSDPCPEPLPTPWGWGMMEDVADAAAEGARNGMPEVALAGAGVDSSADDDESAPSSVTPVGQVRQNFPETWIFDEVMVGGPASGSVATTVSKDLVVPDSITEWRVAAFATHQVLGFSDGDMVSNALRVKKMVFVSMSMPPFVVQHEEPTIVLTVQNLLPESLTDVLLTIRLPVGLTPVTWPDGVADSTNGGDGHVGTGRVTVDAGGYWRGDLKLLPTVVEQAGLPIYVAIQTSAAVGQSDAVERSLVVRPSGHLVKVAANVLLQDPVQPHTFTLPAELADATAGSKFARLGVVGDILGNAMANLERLVSVPTGCGEQTMLGLAPNVYVLSYLHSSGRLGADMRQRLVRNINVGYQRELMYRHTQGDSAGGFSAFGSSDEEASTWLTAYVLKVLAQASQFVTIDGQVLSSAGEFLKSAQDANDGHFRRVGRVIHEDMMGGATTPTGLTAYVTAALAAADTALGRTEFVDVRRRAATYLKQDLSSKSNYTQVLALTAMAAGGLMTAGDAAGQALSLRHGSPPHWSAAPVLPERSLPTGARAVGFGMPWHHIPATLDVETTAYGIMLLVDGGIHVEAVASAQWLVSKQNPEGGFVSTQDTVVGLESLARVAETLSSNAALTCRATYGGNDFADFQVGRDNFDLLQFADIGEPTPNAEVVLSCSGRGAVVATVATQWNTKVPLAPPVYEVSQQWRALDPATGIASATSSAGTTSGLMEFTVCAEAVESGADYSSLSEYHLCRMSVYSGYVVLPESCHAVGRGDKLIDNVEQTVEGVNIYLGFFPAEGFCLSCRSERAHLVDNLQAARVVVESYYDQRRYGEETTSLHSATDPERDDIVDATLGVSSQAEAFHDVSWVTMSFSIVAVLYRTMVVDCF